MAKTHKELKSYVNDVWLNKCLHLKSNWSNRDSFTVLGFQKILKFKELMFTFHAKPGGHMGTSDSVIYSLWYNSNMDTDTIT